MPFYKSKRILCTICARGGSKAVPNKNLQMLAGLPLIAHSIAQAKQAQCFVCIAVSSDSEAILEVSKQHGADILIKRPMELAADQSAKLPAIRHCAETATLLKKTQFDVFVDLDATAPLRTPLDITNAIDLLLLKDADNIITGCRARRSPFFNLVRETRVGTVTLFSNQHQSIVRRQEAPSCYDMNASIYVWNNVSLFAHNTLFLDKTYLYEMPEERSIDIDTPLDMQIVKYLMESKLAAV